MGSTSEICFQLTLLAHTFSFLSHGHIKDLQRAQLCPEMRLKMSTNIGLSNSTSGGSDIIPIVDLGKEPPDKILVVKCTSKGDLCSRSELLGVK
jgi:hypothetical protein